MQRITLLIGLLFSVFYGSDAQSFNDRVYRSYVTGNIDNWERLLKENQGRTPTVTDQYDHAMAHYGFIVYCIGRDQKKKAKPYLDYAEELLDGLLKTSPEDPRYLSLRGTLYGLRMTYQPQKMMVLGPKSMKAINLALEKGPECPQALIENGNLLYSMPEIFGGSKDKGMANYEKAIKMIEKDPSLIRNSWYYLHINMVLGNWNADRGRTFAARELYRKMLQIEPEFVWAKEKLAGK